MSGIPFARRNDPCPCGSGLRYKACHGRLEAPDAARGVEEAARILDAGRLDEAIAAFDRVLEADPANARAMHLKGFALAGKGDFDRGLPLLERGADLDAGNADFRNRVGLVRYVMGEHGAAVRELERAAAIDPGNADAHANLALALRDQGELDRALGETLAALALKPGLPAAHINHAMILLALGRFGEAWPEYSWRADPRRNLRDVAARVVVPIPHAAALPRSGAITLHGEQGLGDTLFFMRFAPLLAVRGYRLRFWGDARLAAMLERAGLVSSAFPGDATPPDLDPSRSIWVGDLPHLLATGETTPPPARLAAEPARIEAVRARLAALGPAPHVAITWRAGLERRGKAVLAKAIEPAALGAALRGASATFVSVQRKALAGEREALEAALGRPVHDLAAMNDDLEDMLALMHVAGEYVAVSNTNVHLRAGAGRPTRVLVPYPPEWRWMREARRSPWFPDCPLYRQRSDGSWDDALAGLARDLR